MAAETKLNACTCNRSDPSGPVNPVISFFCSCPVLSCILFVSCIFLYLRLLLITDYLSTSVSRCLPMGQTWTQQSRIWSTKNWPTVIFLWWLTPGHAVCTKCTMHLQNVSLLWEYCRDTIMPNKCSEIGFWSPVKCPVIFSDVLYFFWLCWDHCNSGFAGYCKFRLVYW